MFADDLELEFSSRGTWRGRALLLDERTALALIDRAALAGVGIRGIDQVRRGEVNGYATLKGEDAREPVDRSASWDQARGFVKALAGRDLLFEVVLDDSGERRPPAQRTFMTAADTRSVLVSALALVGLVTLFVVWAGMLP